MCLQIITKYFSEQESSQIINGWKAVRISHGNCYSPFYGYKTPITSKWMDSEQKYFISLVDPLYESGFSVFRNRVDAERWLLELRSSRCWKPPFTEENSAIISVQVTNLVCEGLLDSSDVVIGKRMRINVNN